MKPRFEKVLQKISNLQKHDKYIAALIFGSLARGGANEDSDVDVIIVTNEDSKEMILHPYINKVKLDLSFYSIDQLKKKFDSDLQGKSNREPLIARSKILFDKSGETTELVDKLNKIKPPKWTSEVEAEQRFLMYHANDKVVRNLKTAPIAAMYSMNVGVNDLLKIYYMIKERWWLSNKKLLTDLKEFDVRLYDLVENFLKTNHIDEKYQYWNQIYIYIHDQIGGIKSLDEKIPEEFKDTVDLLVN